MWEMALGMEEARQSHKSEKSSPPKRSEQWKRRDNPMEI
jgi:hypothetical protein